ncbi:hypothetical protein Esti_003877 [Eimeria stiedai]
MLSRLDRFLCWVLSGGPVPSHVAFVMDGNRRFARQRNEETTEGHKQGAEALKRVTAACAAVGVRVVSVYGFALGNFHRHPKEVKGLLRLAEALLRDPLWIQDFLMAERIRLVVVGDLSFVGPRLRAAAAAAEKETRHNKRLLLRLCVSYGARHEVYRALTAHQQPQQQQEQQQQQQEQQQELDDSSSAVAAEGPRLPEGASGVETPQAGASPPAATATAAAAAAEGEPLLPPPRSRTPICEQLRSLLPQNSWQPDELTRRYAKAFWVSLQGGDYALPEVLIRTSGEARLSDFLLCEVHQQQQRPQQQRQETVTHWQRAAENDRQSRRGFRRVLLLLGALSVA